MDKDKVEVFYYKHYKKLMLIPIILLVISLIYIGSFYAKTGDLFVKDVSLKGGVSATVYTEKEINLDELKNHLKVDAEIRKLEDFTSGKQIGYLIEESDLPADKLQQTLEEFFGFRLTQDNYTAEETGAKLGKAFTKQLLLAVLFAFILMAITIFITFRTPAPSLAVVFAAFIDITFPLALVDFLKIPISTAGIIGFLLVIGYSVDTDILLTTWAIRKKEKTLFERMFHSMKTGLTMTFAAMGVMLVGIIFSNSVVIKEMFTIILFALFTDIIATYLTNAGILMWYCQKKGIK